MNRNKTYLFGVLENAAHQAIDSALTLRYNDDICLHVDVQPSGTFKLTRHHHEKRDSWVVWGCSWIQGDTHYPLSAIFHTCTI